MFYTVNWPIPAAPRSPRAVSSVIAIILLVAVTVILASVISVFALGLAEGTDSGSPVLTTSHRVVDAGGDPLVAVTHEGGDAVDADHLTVTGSIPIDIGGRTTADDEHASRSETFDEGSDQVGVGEYWDAGETVYFDPDGDVEGLRLRFVWSEQPAQNVNPGNPSGESAYVVARITIGG